MVYTADLFFRDFVQSAQEHITLTEYKSSLPEFTEKIMHLISEIVDQIPGEYTDNLISQKEYFRIDVSGWESKSKSFSKAANAVNLNSYAWDLRVAVEHENNPKLWLDEVVKLAHIHCPLKVVIGYCGWQERNMDFEKLDLASKILNSVNAFDNSSDGEFLVILGNCSSSSSSEYGEMGYKGYLYNPLVKEFIALI